MTEEPADFPCLMVMINAQSRRLCFSPRGSLANKRRLATDRTQPLLLLFQVLILFEGDSVMLNKFVMPKPFRIALVLATFRFFLSLRIFFAG